MLDFANYSVISKYYDDSKALVLGKVKDEMGGVAVKKLIKARNVLDGSEQF